MQITETAHMTEHTSPTAFWVIRDCDDVRFTLVETHSEAINQRDQYETEFEEPFRVASEHRTVISFNELPESWEYDWADRIPEQISVTDVPVYAVADLIDQPETTEPTIQMSSTETDSTITELQNSLTAVVKNAISEMTEFGLQPDDWIVDTRSEPHASADELWITIWFAETADFTLTEQREEGLVILKEALKDADTGLPMVVNANYEDDVAETGIACWWNLQ